MNEAGEKAGRNLTQEEWERYMKARAYRPTFDYR